jgi:hypothetical protein
MAAIGYHFNAKTISRSAGRSAVAAIAYRIGDRLFDERTGEVKDFSRKRGVEFVHHVAPENAPAWAQTVETAWNEIERVENRKNSTLAREFEAAFPHQLSQEQRAWMLKDFMREELTRKGFLATGAIHAPSREGDERNFHCHIMLAERQIGAEGFARNKDRRFCGFEERKDTLAALKDKWALLGARQLARAGHQLEADRWRHGHKTLAEQRAAALARGDLDYVKECEREAGTHLGVHATAMERKGIATERGDLNRGVESRNRDRAELRAVQVDMQKTRAEIAKGPHSVEREQSRQRTAEEWQRIREENTARRVAREEAKAADRERRSAAATVERQMRGLVGAMEKTALKTASLTGRMVSATLETGVKLIGGLFDFLAGPAKPPPLHEAKRMQQAAKEKKVEREFDAAHRAYEAREQERRDEIARQRESRKAEDFSFLGSRYDRPDEPEEERERSRGRGRERERER